MVSLWVVNASPIILLSKISLVDLQSWMIRRRGIAPPHLGIPHQGTLALIIYAKQQGLVPAARPLVERLRQEGMYLSDQIVNQALAQIGE